MFGHSSQKSLENKAKFEMKFPSKLDFHKKRRNNIEI